VNAKGMTSSPGMWMPPANLDATQCKMARAALWIGVRELAARAVVSPDTVSRLEKGNNGVTADTQSAKRHSRENPSGLTGEGSYFNFASAARAVASRLMTVPTGTARTAAASA
jgi:transcriptional regulator with XRE-family HTH domain